MLEIDIILYTNIFYNTLSFRLHILCIQRVARLVEHKYLVSYSCELLNEWKPSVFFGPSTPCEGTAETQRVAHDQTRFENVRSKARARDSEIGAQVHDGHLPEAFHHVGVRAGPCPWDTCLSGPSH